MIELRDLSIGFLKKSLFQGVSLRFLPNERYGVVGANGSGKSTFLKIIAGELEADDGEVDVPNNLQLFCIGQEHSLDDEMLIIDAAMMGQYQVFKAMQKKQELLKKKPTSENALEIAGLEEIIESNEGYRLASKSEAVLEGLGILKSDHNKPLKILSGGYKWRVFLAQVLIKNPDILLLDEPTNHLDIISIRWLESFLCNYKGHMILVSHDKRFMDNVCTQILDIDFNTITTYAGNYTKFSKARSLYLLQKEKELLAQEKEIKRKRAFIDRFRYKATKARQAQSRVKQIERMEIIEPIKSSRIHPKFKFENPDKSSKEVLNVKNLSKSYGEKVILKNVSFNVKRGDKIAVIGSNGSGKSTLIKALGLNFFECNRFINWGYSTTRGYFAQDVGKSLKLAKKNILEWLWQFCADKPQSFVQGMLGRMLFTKDDAKKNTKDLSGGELSRLYLAYLMIMKPNVLLLDEPTNHLDLESIESLTNALSEYTGTLIFVSHDRMFIDNVAHRIIKIGKNEVDDFLGTYSEFVLKEEHDYLDANQQTRSLEKKSSTKNKSSYEEQKKKRSIDQKLRRDLEKIMISVEDVEEKINAIDQLFLDEDFFLENDFLQINKLEQEKARLKEDLDVLLERWEKTEKSIALSAEE